MSILDEGKPVPISRYAGQVDYQGPQKVINGCAVLCRNGSFLPDAVKTRFGMRTTMARQQVGADITGIDVLEVLGLNNPGEVPVCFSALGELLRESPVGSGALVALTPPYTLPASARMQTTQAENDLFMGFTDGAKGLVPPVVYDGPTNTILPISPNPIGGLWKTGILYRLGDLVRSSDGRWWRCNLAATGLSSANAPAWPTLAGYFFGAAWVPTQVVDNLGGNSRWEEWTPNCTNQIPSPDVIGSNAVLVDNPGGGTIIANQDVYIELSYVIPGVGETVRSVPLVFLQTDANDEIFVQIGSPGSYGGPRMPRWLAEIILQPQLFAPFFVNVYVAVVATGSNPPAQSAYNLYDTFSVGAEIVVTSAGLAPPAANYPTASGGAYATPANAYDGNFATASVGAAVSFRGGGVNAETETWSGFSARGAGQTGLRLNVNSSVLSPIGSGIAGNVNLRYSLDNGATWANFYSVSTNRGKQTDSIPLSNAQDLTHVKVQGNVSAGGTFYIAGSAQQSVYEIWIGGAVESGYAPLPAALITLITPNAPSAFRGSNGPRYMIVGRQNPQGSLAAIDPDSAITVNIQGAVTVGILSIVRNSSGVVQATVTDVSQFAPGQSVTVLGCTNDTTFNGGNFVVSSVLTTLAPEGIVTFTDPNNNAASEDNTGSLLVLPSAPVVAILPPGGPEDALDIAAFTVAGGSKAGPFFYLGESDPPIPVSAPIVSLTGEGEVTSAISSITRYAGGEVLATVATIAGFAIGQLVSISGVPTDPSFNEDAVITSIEPIAGGITGTIGYVSAANTASGPYVGGVASTTVEPGQVVAIVQSAVGLLAGQVVAIENASVISFDQLATIASVTGNSVLLSMQATGVSTGGQMVVQQNLPGSSASGPRPITAISRDAGGNVVAQVPNLGGWAAGQIVIVANVADPSFNGVFQLRSAELNPDGLTGVLGWSQVGAAGNSAGGTVVSESDIIINFDDAALESGIDITDQLTAIPAPTCSDLYFVPSLRMMTYVDNDHYPSAFLFSDPDDPANITGSSGDPNNPGSGILSVDANAQKRAVGIREMRNGEVLAVKENGGFALATSQSFPSAWQPTRRWDEFGPLCAEAMCLSNSDESDFLTFASEYGAFIYMGGTLKKISREIAKTWKRLNLAAKNTAACGVNVERRTIHFLLPLDGALTPNYELVCSYYDGWEDPEVLNRYGKLITPRACRKWSIQPLSARTCKFVRRHINGVVPAPSVGGHPWAYTDANIVGGACTFTFANAAAVPPVQIGQSISSSLTGVVVVTGLTATTIVTGSGIGAGGDHGAGSLFMVTKVLPSSADERVAEKQFLYGASGANTPLKGLGVTTLVRAGNVVTATIALAGYLPVPSELANVILTGALDVSFNGTFATTGYMIVGQVLTITWNQNAPPGATGAGVMLTTLSMSRVTMDIPDVYDDDGVGIDFQYQPWLTQTGSAILDFLGFRGELAGSGVAQLIVTSDVKGDVLPGQDIILPGAIGSFADPPFGQQFERAVRFRRKYGSTIITNRAMPGSYVEIIELVPYVQPWLTGTRGDR